LSVRTDTDDSAFGIYGGNGGFLIDNGIRYQGAVRPVLYLEASVQIAGGNGSKANPYKLS
jgi:hypothetical protein